jgi:hypothetical protein
MPYWASTNPWINGALRLRLPRSRSLKSTDNPYSLIDVHNRINQLLDQSLLEAAVMKAFHRLGDLIQDEGVLNYMFFSMLEGLLEYDVAALYFQNQNAANLNVTFHLGQPMTLPPVTLETLKEQFFRTLNDHHVLPEMISPQDSPHSKPLRFEMIGYPETEGDPDTLHLSHFQVFEVGSKLLGAFALYSRKPNIEYKAVFPLQLMMDELHHLMKLKRLSSENLYLSRSDRLTSMLQHRAFMEHLDQEFHRAQRYELDMTLAVIEIRQFKHYNNTGGYALGDAVLKHVAKLMRSCFRSTDILARLGSARLAVLMPETTLEDAKAVLCSL